MASFLKHEAKPLGLRPLEKCLKERVIEQGNTEGTRDNWPVIHEICKPSEKHNETVQQGI